MAEHQLTCAHCCAQFVSSRKRKYCTALCKSRAQHAKRYDAIRKHPKGWVPVTQTDHTCIVCDKVFRPKSADRTKCCSRECGWRLTRMVATVTRNGGRVSVAIARKKCPTCGGRHSGQGTYCHAQCRPTAYRAVVDAVCRKCGRQFSRGVDGHSAHYCTEDCKDIARKDSARPGKKKRRAIERGANGGERIDPSRVFARDGWKCCKCGKSTPEARRGSYRANAPELDHIIPVSRGGSHTYTNTQCLCRSCNAKKGAAIGGQLHLFPAG